MLFVTPQIVWHDNVAPIYSVDFQQNVIPPGTSEARFATGGRDSNIRIWILRCKQTSDAKGTENQIEYRATLSRHERTVNVVRFSKRGDLLASGSDDCTIVIWQQSGNENNAIRPEEPSAVEKGKTVKRPVVIFADDSNSFFEPERDQLEKWQAIRVLRAHVEDVYDLAWCSLQMAAPKSADSEGEEGELLLSGSMDGSTILWHARAGRKICNVKNHDGFVQGVAVDPRGELAASISSDRTVLLYRLNQAKDGAVELSEKFVRVTKALLPKVSPANEEASETAAASGGKQEKRVVKLFHDDSWKSFFRRLSFSPDGELLVVPSGVYPTERRVRLRAPPQNASANEFVTEMVDSHVCYVFSRTNAFAVPFSMLPTDGRPAIAVRFCPVRFALRVSDGNRLGSLLASVNYRWLFAVLTADSVLFYDTEQKEPFAYATDLHYGTLNDVAWCVSQADNTVHVLVCSTDGYCSTIVFSLDDLGKPLVNQSETALDCSFAKPMDVDVQPLDDAVQLLRVDQAPSVQIVSEPTTPSSNAEPKKRRIALTTISNTDAP